MAILLCSLLATPLLPAQGTVEDVGAWFIFAGQGRFDPAPAEPQPWRWWFDGQLRFSDDSDGFDQSILRPGLGYALGEKTTLWLGYGWFHSDPAATPAHDEHRIWQQLTWDFGLGEQAFGSRTRLEQRFLDTGDDVGWRFRQMLRWTPPRDQASGIGLRVWDELFFGLNDTDWGASAGFDQNRFFIGPGFTFGESNRFTFEVGYLHQYIRRETGPDASNHILFAQLLFTL